MRRLTAVLLAVLLGACNDEIPGIDCDETSDCAAGAVCEGHVCIDTTCEPACSDFLVCAHAECIPAFLRPVIVEPATGSTLLGGGKVRARLDRALEGSIEPPPELELVATPQDGAPLTLRLTRVAESLEYESVFVAPDGTYELKVRLASAGLESAPVTVTLRNCTAQCAAYEECIAAECHKVFSRLAFVGLGEYAQQRPVHLRARIERALANSTVAPPPEVDVIAQPSDLAEPARLQRIAGTDDYEGYLTVAEDGHFSLVLRSDAAGVQSDPANVIIDTERPSLLVEVLPPTRTPSSDVLQTTETGIWANALRRDEEAQILVTCGDAGSGVDPSTVHLTAQAAGGNAFELPLDPSSACEASPQCCFTTTLSLYDQRLPLEGFHGTFHLNAAIADRLGHATTATKELLVTRWKWAADLRGGPIRTSPAIGTHGDVYVGTISNLVFRASSSGTASLILTTSGPVTASPIVDMGGGKDTLYIAGKWGNTSSVRCSSSTMGALWRIDNADDAAFSPSCILTAGNNIAAGIGLTSISFGAEPAASTVFGVAEGTLPRLFAIQPGPGEDLFNLPSASDASTGVALNGRRVFFGNNLGQIDAYELDSTGNLVHLTGWPATIGNGNRPNKPIITRNQRIAGGAGGGIGTGAIFRARSDGQELMAASTGSPTFNAINVVSGAESLLVAGADSGNVFVTLEDFSATQLQAAFNLGGTSSAGAAAGADKTLYFSTEASTLQARRLDGALLWEAPLRDASQSAPALDCNRDSTGVPISKPGIVYVGDEAGVLYAFITDGHGLDYASPWPKVHRDAQNTSDASRDLSALACP